MTSSSKKNNASDFSLRSARIRVQSFWRRYFNWNAFPITLGQGFHWKVLAMAFGSLHVLGVQLGTGFDEGMFGGKVRYRFDRGILFMELVRGFR